MRIYRLEHLRSHKGPYYHAAFYNEPLCLELTYAHQDKPSPLEDFPLRNEDLILYRFGCLRRQGVDDWFAGWLPRLGLIGFAVRALEVEPRFVLFGASGQQVAVHRDCGGWG